MTVEMLELASHMGWLDSMISANGSVPPGWSGTGMVLAKEILPALCKDTYKCSYSHGEC